MAMSRPMMAPSLQPTSAVLSADYLRRYGPLYQAIEAEQAAPLDWGDEALLAQLEQERRAQLKSERLPERSAWRDRRLMALAAHRREVIQ
jgi:L-gulonate 3-dehydrogenase